MRVAAVSWEIQDCPSIDSFFDHFRRLVRSCAGCGLIVFPELPCLELLTHRDDLSPAEMPGWLADQFAPVIGRFSEIAVEAKTDLVAGTYFSRANGGVTNNALTALSDGAQWIESAKVVLTQFEAVEWKLRPGQGLKRHLSRNFGVTVCYDSEFPLSARSLAESGCVIQAVPAFTESEYGFNRVRWSCHSRTIENQIFVIHSSLVGSLGREPVPGTYGSSAVLCPPHPEFGAPGVLVETPFNVEGVAIAEIDLGKIQSARDSGDVRNWHDRDRGDWTVTSIE